ncbi:FMN-binding protein [Arthrobacter sp. MDT2-16]
MAITVADGVITDVNTVITAANPVSQNINERVESLLDNAVLTEQSSDITMISGSTYTSQAYAASLQAALNEATP